jgi:flagellar hook-associated protein 2
MADYSSGAIYFSGLGSDIDFDSIISATISAESSKYNELSDWADAWQEKVDALQELNTGLLTLRTSLQALDSPDEFLSMDAQSTDSAVGVSANGDAEEGSHAIVVNQLAQNDVWVCSAGASSATSAVTASNASFSYAYAGTSYTVSVPAGTTLQGLASLITNNSGSKGEVKATVINDGSACHLQIYGMDLGAGNAVSVGASTLSGYAGSNFEHTQTAQSAQFKVDGYPTASGAWITRDSNTVDDAITGLTLTLRGATDSASISVSLDTDTLKTNIESFVDAYNTLKTLIDTDTDVADDGTGSVLTGNYGAQMVESELKDILASSGLGFSYYDADTGLGDLFTSLSQVGITTDVTVGSDTYGLLVIDDSTLDEALDQDPAAVAKVFCADYDGDTDSADFSYVSCIKGTTAAGSHQVDYQIQGGAIAWATIDGQTAQVVDGWQITALQGTEAAGLTVNVDNHADGTYGGAASLRLGKVAQMADRLADLTDADSGVLNIIADNYGDIVSDAQDRMDQEQDRLDQLEARLKTRYANLESVLGTYQDQLDQLDSLLSSLSSD